MEIIQEIGAYAGLAAIVGLAVLSALYFSQARDVRRLREWAGRAPERSTGQMGRPQVPAPPPVSPASAARPAVRPAQPATRPVQPAAAAAAAPAPAARPAAATAAGKQTAPAGVAVPGAVAAQANAPPPPVAGAPPGGASEAEAAPKDAEVGAATAQVATATAPEDAREEASPAGGERPAPGEPKEVAEAPSETPAAEEADAPREETAAAAGAEPRPTPAATSGEARAEVAAPPAGGDARPGEPGGDGAAQGAPAPATPAPAAPPLAGATRDATGPQTEDREREAGPPPGQPVGAGAPVAVHRVPAPTAPPRPPARTAVLPPYPGKERERWYKRFFGEPRYAVLGVVGVLVVGAAAAFGISEVAKEEAPPLREQRGAAAGGGSSGAEKPRAPVSPGKVTVAVLNGTTVPGLAAQIGDRIEGRGFQLGNITNSTDQQRNESVVLYAPGHEREAAMVGRRLGVAQREPIDPESQALGGDATVVVIAGADQTR